MKDTLRIVALFVLVVGLMGFGIGCEYRMWKECRRIHPWWYCIDRGGSH